MKGSPENVPVVSGLGEPFPLGLDDDDVTLVKSKEHNVVLKM